MRGAHGVVDVCGVAALNLVKNLPVGRVQHGNQQAAAGCLRCVGDVIQLHGCILRSSHARSSELAGFWAAHKAVYLQSINMSGNKLQS
jgi:hypothetical protein